MSWPTQKAMSSAFSRPVSAHSDGHRSRPCATITATAPPSAARRPLAQGGTGRACPPKPRRRLRTVTVTVTVKTVEPTPTAVVAEATTWAEFPAMWMPMLDKVWGFLRGGAPEGLYKQGHNVMLYKDDVPNVEVGVQVSGSFDRAGDVVASTLRAGLSPPR